MQSIFSSFSLLKCTDNCYIGALVS